MRLIFMGTPRFAVPVLDALVEDGHEIAAVYTQPPRPAGRGQREQPSPVAARAVALGLPVRTPRSLKPEGEREAFAALGAELAVVVAYGLLLPQPVLDAPRHGCINVHASLLPRWRGAAPIHRAVMAGDARTGICIMAMEAGLDTGPVLLREETAIGPTDTAGDLHERLAEMGARLAVRAARQIEHLSPVAQLGDGVTYAAKIDKGEAQVDLGWSAAIVARHVNGLSPAPGAWIEHAGGRLRLLRARALDGTATGAPPGTVLDRPGLVVAAGEGAVELLDVQPAGKPPLAGADWRRGARLEAGSRLGSVE